MLSDLTSNPIADLAPGTGNSGPSSSSSSMPVSKRKRGLVTPQSARSRRSSGGGSTASRGSIGGSARRPPVPSAWTVRDYEDDTAASADGDYGDDDVGGVEHFDGEDGEADATGDGDGDAAMQDVGASVATVVESGEASSGAAAGGEEKPVAAAAAVVSPEAPGGQPAAAKPRSRFARLKETNDIEVTAAAEEALRPKKPEIAEKDPAAAVDGKMGGEGKAAAGGVGSSYMPSLEFQGPQYSLSEAPSTSAGSVPSASSWLQKVQDCVEYLTLWYCSSFGVPLGACCIAPMYVVVLCEDGGTAGRPARDVTLGCRVDDTQRRCGVPTAAVQALVTCYADRLLGGTCTFSHCYKYTHDCFLSVACPSIL